MNGGGGEMTLAFELSALQALSDPGAVFDDARRWTKYVGVVSDKPTYVVTNFTRKHRIRQDFFSGPRGKAESLESVKGQFDTDRHVFIGVSDEDSVASEAQRADGEVAEQSSAARQTESGEAVDAAVAAETGWEFLPVEDAAEAADWTLAGDGEDEDVAEEPTRDDWP